MIALDKLVALVCGDLGEAEAEQVELHLLACDDCSRRAEQLQATVAAIGELARSGAVRAIVTGSTLDQLRAQGLPRGEYELTAGQTVSCRIAPGDLFNVVTLRADLSGAERLSMLVVGPDGATLDRVDDIPFDPSSDRIITIETGAALRALPTIRLGLRLLETSGDEERVIGDYGLDHNAE